MKHNFDERKQNRIDRFEDLADKNASEAQSLRSRADQISERFAFGQPILVGHHSEKRARRDQEKIHNSMRASFAAEDKSKYYADRAEAARKNKAIFSDDPNAVEKLEDKIARLEKMQEMMKQANKLVRKNDREALLDMGFSELAVEQLFKPDFCGRIGFADYKITNNGANIRRLKQRLEQEQKKASIEYHEIQFSDRVYVAQNPDANRTQIFFPGKPSDEIRETLKRNGFRWSPSEGAWQIHLSSHSFNTAKYVLERLGINCLDTHPGKTIEEVETEIANDAAVLEAIEETPIAEGWSEIEGGEEKHEEPKIKTWEEFDRAVETIGEQLNDADSQAKRMYEFLERFNGYVSSDLKNEYFAYGKNTTGFSMFTGNVETLRRKVGEVSEFINGLTDDQRGISSVSLLSKLLATAEYNLMLADTELRKIEGGEETTPEPEPEQTPDVFAQMVGELARKHNTTEALIKRAIFAFDNSSGALAEDLNALKAQYPTGCTMLDAIIYLRDVLAPVQVLNHCQMCQKPTASEFMKPMAGYHAVCKSCRVKLVAKQEEKAQTSFEFAGDQLGLF